ncbi:hypothetical protein NQD34_000798 [Periophthalmus magnuspinnatus]|uniref:interleukin-21 n=1 Tax=Periophthalmus magnuspinnatus TaxID=409849 RepID=UPI0022CBAAF2|nr:interleukin-21 [Periophthalmus magnuspinnatus]KAJ0033691.1 hypothetical protein NQD34_000798 [Periophthalmus magnuspinnatus]
MRTLPLTVHPTCTGHSQKGVFLQLLSLCTEAYRGPVWLWLLLLSGLCRPTWASHEPDLGDVQICLKGVTNSIQNSDAKLYAPSVDEIEENCERWFLHCYMLELHMVLSEELIEGDDTDCIAHFLYNSPKVDTGSCPACEAMALRNSTTFLDNLKSLLEKYEAS